MKHLIGIISASLSAFFIGIPGLVFGYMTLFASNRAKEKFRRFLLKQNLRVIADCVVPDLAMDLSELDDEVKLFKESLKLPRLVDTTPELSENALSIDENNVLGRGGFAIVFKGTIKQNGTTVAVKCLFNENKGPFNANTPNSIKKELSRESAIVCSLNHPNPRSEKTSATSRGCPREEPTTSIQNGVKKRRGGMRRERERESAEGVCDLPRFLFFRCRVLTNERKGVARISPPVVLK